MKGGGDQKSLHPEEELLVTMGERCKNDCLSFRMHLCYQKQQSVIRTQISDIWKTGSPPTNIHSCKLCATASRTGAQLPRAGEWVTATVLRTEIDQNYHNLPPKSSSASLQQTPEFQNSCIGQILSV